MKAGLSPFPFVYFFSEQSLNEKEKVTCPFTTKEWQNSWLIFLYPTIYSVIILFYLTNWIAVQCKSLKLSKLPEKEEIMDLYVYMYAGYMQKKNPFVFYDFKSVYPASIY